MIVRREYGISGGYFKGTAKDDSGLEYGSGREEEWMIQIQVNGR